MSIRMGIRRLGALCAVLALAACAPPDPLDCDTRCGTDDDTKCGVPDAAVSDVIPGDADDLAVPDEVEPTDAPEGDADVTADAADLLPDGIPCPETVEVVCPEEHPCPDTGVCLNMPRDCVDKDGDGAGEWVCDFLAVEGFELGGETLCDGQDNDCDGLVDEALPLPDEAVCSTQGVCADAVVACVDGQWDCGTDGLAGYESEEATLDGLDNDCDGLADQQDGLGTVCDLPGAKVCDGPEGYKSCNGDGNGYSATKECPGGTLCMGEGVCTAGDAFMVNEYKADAQTETTVTAVGGAAVVAWRSLGQDASDYGIYYRAYDEAGEELLPESRANLYTLGAQQSPVLAPIGDDAFFIGWESNGQDGSGMGVYGRTIALAGGASAEVALSEVTLGAQQALALAGLSGGGVAALWADAAGGGTVKGAVVGSQGFPVPGNADVALPGNLPQAGLAAVQLADGKLAAIFEKKSGFDWNLEGRLLADVEGGAWTFASTLSLPADANALETSPHVVVSGDNVFLAWLDEDPQVVRGCVRRYDAAFANPSADGCAEPEGAGIVAVALASLHDGRAVLAWQDSGVPDHTVNVAVVDGSGNLGEAVAVDVDEMDSTGALGVAGFAGGKAVITWTRSAPGTGLDVWAKFLQLD